MEMQGKAPNFKIVILDDNEFYNQILSRFLSTNLKKTGLLKGFTVSVASYTSYVDCLKSLDDSVDVLFTDYFLSNGYTASDIIGFVNDKLLRCKVVVVSQIQTLQTSALTVLAGAYEFIKKGKKTLYQCNDIAETIITEKLGVLN
jgi:DNA-binding NtrC family response regulator